MNIWVAKMWIFDLKMTWIVQIFMTVLVLLWNSQSLKAQETLLEQFLNDLETETGLTVEKLQYQNFAKSAYKSSVYMISPTQRQQIQAAVRVCKQYGVRVRAGGSAHAFSDHLPNEDNVLIKMQDFGGNNGTMFKTEPTNWKRYTTLATAPGNTLEKVLGFLAGNGVALHTVTTSLRPTIGGVTATGSHGHNARYPAISADLENVQLVQYDGEMREFDIDNNPDVFPLFRAHLGLCGIITRLTFKVEKYPFCQRWRNVTWTWEDVVNRANLQGLMNNYHQFIGSLKIFSSAPKSAINAMQRYGGMSNTAWFLKKDHVTFTIHSVMNASTTEHMNNAVWQRIFNDTLQLASGAEAPAQLDYGYFPNIAEYDDAHSEYPITAHCQFSFSDNSNLYRAIKIFDVIHSAIVDHAFDTKNKFMPLDGLEFGFTRHDQSCLLCPSSIASLDPLKTGSDLVFFINFRFRMAWEEDANKLMRTMYDAWKANSLNGLPHLGKYVPTWALDDARSLMQPNIDTFRALRTKAGLDPIDIFTNGFLDSIIFPDVDRSGEVSAVSGTGVVGASQSTGVQLRVAPASLLLIVFVMCQL